MDSSISYTAAGQYPIKLLKKSEDVIVDDAIVPYHIQLIPTNRCNGGCRWCSCANVDRGMELSLEEIVKILQHFTNLGAKAITITGGGEPSLHPHISAILHTCRDLGLTVGLVTNGIKWSKQRCNAADEVITWSRISVTDTESGDYPVSRILDYASLHPGIEIGVSFTVTSNVSVDLARQICRDVDSVDNITHIRFVQDITELDNATMQNLVEHCDTITDKSIFQFRDNYTQGQRQCWISQLKPVINCDGYVYPCCGVQYANGNQLTMPEEFRMCHWQEWPLARPFNGCICTKCYYEGYNDLLDKLLSNIEHEDFI